MPTPDLGVDRSEGVQKDARISAQHEWAATDELIKLNKTLKDGKIFFLNGGPRTLAGVESATGDVEEAEVLIEDGVDGAFALTEYGGPVTVGGDEAITGGTT